MRVVRVWVVSLKAHSIECEADEVRKRARNIPGSNVVKRDEEYEYLRVKARRTTRRWRRDYLHADEVDARGSLAGYPSAYVVDGTEAMERALRDDARVNTYTDWWALNEEVDEKLESALDEITTRPDAWTIGDDSPLWFVEKEAEQALKEIERELAK